MASIVIAIFVCYWLSRMERKYIFKQPVGVFIAFLNAIIVSIISTVVAVIVVYVLIVENLMRPEYKVVGEGIIREAMFGLVFSSIVSFSLLRAELKPQKKEPEDKNLKDEDNPWMQK